MDEMKTLIEKGKKFKELELQKDIFGNPNKEKSKCLLKAL
jgi:hypothetical protein